MTIRKLHFPLIFLVATSLLTLATSVPAFGQPSTSEVVDPTPLGVGLEFAIDGELTSGDDGIDWYSFTATAGQNYIIELKPTIATTQRHDDPSDDHPTLVPGHLTDPSILEVLDEDQVQLVGEQDDGGLVPNSARASLSVEYGGTHFVAVGAGQQDRNATGYYTVSVRADDYRTVSDVTLHPGESITATIDSDVAVDDERLNPWDWIQSSLPNAVGLRPHPGVESLDDRDVIRVEFPETGWYRLDVSNAPTDVGIWNIWHGDGDIHTYVIANPLASIEDHFFRGTLYVEIGTPYASEGNTGSYTLSLVSVEPDP